LQSPGTISHIFLIILVFVAQAGIEIEFASRILIAASAGISSA
jgi:hypothetical protein